MFSVNKTNLLPVLKATERAMFSEPLYRTTRRIGIVLMSIQTGDMRSVQKQGNMRE